MLPKILLDSFGFLCKHPGFFIPKLINATIWNFIYFYWLRGIFYFISSYDIEYLYTALTALPIALVFSQVSIMLNSMYPVLVKYYKEQGLLKFSYAFKVALEKYPHAFVGYMVPSTIMALLIMPFASLVGYGLFIGNIFYVYLGISFSVVIVFVSGIVFYFSPTAVILEKGNPLKAIKKGIGMGKRNLREITFLTLFSFALLFTAFMFEGSFKGLGFAGFFVVRYVGAIIATYVTVINPNVYLELK